MNPRQVVPVGSKVKGKGEREATADSETKHPRSTGDKSRGGGTGSNPLALIADRFRMWHMESSQLGHLDFM